MTAEEYYRKKDYPVLDKYDKKISKFDYWDFIDFAENYHKSKLKLLNIGVVMPCCLDCKFWKQVSNNEHAINDGNCSKLDRTDKLIINLHLGWEGGYVNDIETDEDFGCRLFERNGA